MPSVRPTPVFAMPQMYTPQSDNVMPTWNSDHRSMNRLPGAVPNFMLATNYEFSDFTDSQYLHQQRPIINLISLSTQQHLDSRMLQPQQPTSGLEMVSDCTFISLSLK